MNLKNKIKVVFGKLSFLLNVKLLCNFFFLLICISSKAQDLHFSQFFNSPLSTNPANTGFIPDADYRIGAHFRNQYSNIMAMPYRTMSLFGDVQLLRDKLQNGWLGAGGLILADEAGSGSLRSTKVYASVAYHQMLGNSSLLSAGFNLGWANKRIDFSKLKFPDQFDGHFFDNTIPTSVVLSNTNISYFDMQAGVNYAFFPKENIYFNAGYSLHHVNQPKESFFESQSSKYAIIPMRHIGFLNAIVKVGQDVILQPNVYYTNQAGSSELVLGSIINYNLAGSGDLVLSGGVYYRNHDAVIPMIGFSYHQIKFIFNYDATISTLKNYNQYRGAGELSIIKSGFYGQTRDRQSLCPSF